MFDLIGQYGNTEREIPLGTLLGTPIQNGVAGPGIYGNLAEWQDDLAAQPSWRPRRIPCGIYNCFGLVFASRRTCVYDPKLIDMILREDRFDEINEQQTAIGDVVVYRNSQGEAIHASVVVERTPLVVGSNVDLILVLSKWGPHSGESIHRVQDVPGRLGADFVKTQFWTDRTRHAI